MIWQLSLCALMVAGLVHARLTGKASKGEVAEMMLVYVLAGYCGVLMLGLGIVAVVNPDWIAINMAGVPPGNAVMIWAGFLFIGLSIASIMTIWHRGMFLVAPVIAWTTYWGGAVYAHIIAESLRGHPLTTESFVGIFIGHGLTAAILVVLTAVWWQGSQAERRTTALAQ
jgi:hypothetical protein